MSPTEPSAGFFLQEVSIASQKRSSSALRWFQFTRGVNLDNSWVDSPAVLQPVDLDFLIEFKIWLLTALTEAFLHLSWKC